MTVMTETNPEMPTSSKASLKPRADEIFRGLWASLFYSGRTGGKSVLVCSSGSGEGSSTVACGLALAGSEPTSGARVALVDFNLRNPSLHRILKLKQSPGVCDVIINNGQPETAAQVLSSTLDVYTAGDVSGRLLDVLRGETVQRFLDALSSGYDYVVVDVAPANQFPDAQILAGLIKDVVLVAYTEQTPREAVAQAKKRLEANGGKLVGLALNMRTYPIPKFLYRHV